jgi:hypothetical protein
LCIIIIIIIVGGGLNEQSKKEIQEQKTQRYKTELKRVRRKMYNIMTIYHKIFNPTVHIAFPWWETYVTYPP